MLTEDEIREAVELVGWLIDDSASGYYYIQPPIIGRGLVKNYWLRHDDPILVDALRCQLERMVDDLSGYDLVVEPGTTEVWNDRRQIIADTIGGDRTENTIRAILQSQVLR